VWAHTYIKTLKLSGAMGPMGWGLTIKA